MLRGFVSVDLSVGVFSAVNLVSSMWELVFLIALLCSVFMHSANKMNLLFVGISGFMTSIPSILLIFVTGAESDSDVDPVCYDFV